MHPQFKLNGGNYDKEALKELAAALSKNGKPFEKAIGDFLQHWLNASGSIIVTTSGSTGKPKKITLQKEHMTNSALATGRFFGLRPGDTALLCLSADFIAGKMMLVRALVLGLGLDVVAPTSDPLQHSSKSYDFCAMVPLQAKHALSELTKIRTLILGGAPVSSGLAEKLKTLKTNIYETYGMTETVSHIAVRQIASAKSLEASSYFQTLPGVRIATDNRGCLVITAPGVSDEKIVTNDLVKQKDTTHFKWLGRHDNVINSGGIKLIPEQIEAKLASSLHQRFFIAGVPDADLGEKVVLFVEGQQNRHQLLEKLKVSNKLTQFEIPKDVVTVSVFKETKSGKVDRKGVLKSLGKTLF